MIIFKGDDKTAYRDPACIYYNNTYYLFFTVSEKENGYMYNCIGLSTSNDLKNWSKVNILTEKNLDTNYSSPGNIIEHNGEFIICFTSYPMPYSYNEKYWANDDARLFTMKTSDFKLFTKPCLLNPKEDMPKEDIGRMIDPFIIKNDDFYYLFFKQNGVSFSKSKDMENWEFMGNTNGGENACVIKHNDEFILVHSPKNGISFSKSKDLKTWQEFSYTTLKQNEWEWADGRITAGFVMEGTKDIKYKYILFFHGSKDIYPETHGSATLAMAFTNDFKTFYYKP